MTTKQAKDDLSALRKFANRVIGDFPNHGSLDAFELQEAAEACGLLRPEERVVPCSDACNCTDYVRTGESVTCYRVTPILKRARQEPNP